MTSAGASGSLLSGTTWAFVALRLPPAITKPVYKPRSKRQRKLDAHKRYLEERLTEGVWNAVILLRELRERGYTGGSTILKDWLPPRRDDPRVVAGG